MQSLLHVTSNPFDRLLLMTLSKPNSEPPKSVLLFKTEKTFHYCINVANLGDFIGRKGSFIFKTKLYIFIFNTWTSICTLGLEFVRGV